MITVQIDTRRLNAAMQEFARLARKDLDFVVRQQAGIMVGQLIALTPPATSKGENMTDRGGINPAAKKAGEARIAADIQALFPTTKLKEPEIMGMMEAGFEWGTGRGKKVIRQFAATEADMERIHKAARSPATGRVRTGSTGQNMALTRSAIRNAYIKRAIQRVGELNAGWLNAARELNTAKRATPAWITRHGPKRGGVSVARVPQGISITVSNRVPYFPKDMEQRIQRVVARRYQGLRKAIEAMIERKAKQANRRMGN
jgi:hypothetical protein